MWPSRRGQARTRRYAEMHDVTLIGELLAVAAISICLLFIVADMGHPERAWHLMPGIGRFNWPIS
jgi:formate-dependent nitrite reductase membrane component NrfD